MTHRILAVALRVAWARTPECRGAGGPIGFGPMRPGRPRSDGPVARVTVELPPELRRRIDAARGPESRSAWLRRAAEVLLRAAPAV